MPFGLKNALNIFQWKTDNIFNKYKIFVWVYINDILVFSKTKEEHVSHLKLVLSEFLKQGIVISGKKAQFFRKNIEFLGVVIGDGHIKFQPHIAKKILDTPPIKNIKALQQFLGLANYARTFIKNLGKLIGPLYSKLGGTGVKQFNIEDAKQNSISKTSRSKSSRSETTLRYRLFNHRMWWLWRMVGCYSKI